MHEARDSNIPEQEGDTPLILASEYGHTEIVALLLEKGAEKDAVNKVSECVCA